MKILRKIIEIDEELCDGCGQCVPGCAEGALKVVDGKARVVSDNLCDGLGACIGECPTGALKIVERETEAFDEDAVEKHLAGLQTADPKPAPAKGGGCPSAQIQAFAPPSPCQAANRPRTLAAEGSALSHWPVQIRLIPPDAPFLKGADLLVVADCVPVAYPALHQRFLEGRVVAIGCPKFDDARAYIDKFAAIFKLSGIRSVTTLIMEVPCCAGLPAIVKKGMQAAGQNIPVKEVVVSTRGDLLKPVSQGV